MGSGGVSGHAASQITELQLEKAALSVPDQKSHTKPRLVGLVTDKGAT